MTVLIDLFGSTSGIITPGQTARNGDTNDFFGFSKGRQPIRGVGTRRGGTPLIAVQVVHHFGHSCAVIIDKFPFSRTDLQRSDRKSDAVHARQVGRGVQNQFDAHYIYLNSIRFRAARTIKGCGRIARLPVLPKAMRTDVDYTTSILNCQPREIGYSSPMVRPFIFCHFKRENFDTELWVLWLQVNWVPSKL